MRTQRNARKGFTLIEVIVVLVILALLAAVMIPAMTGWIDKAKDKSLIISCRACVMAAQTLAVEEYGITGKADSVNEGEVKSFAGVRGDPSDIALTDAAVMKLTYTEDNNSVTYSRDPSPKFTVNAASSNVPVKKGSEGVASMQETLQKYGEENSPNKRSFHYDSGAKASDSLNVQKINDLLLKENIGIDAKSWSYVYNASKAHPSLLYWTDYDLTNYSGTGKVATIRYNASTGSYTVWEMPVVKRDYNGIKLDNNAATTDFYYALDTDHVTKISYKDLSLETFDGAQAVYQRAMASGKYANE